MSLLAKKSLLQKLMDIGAQPAASITGRDLMDHFSEDCRILVTAGIMTKTTNMRDVDIADNHEIESIEIQRQDNKNVYFSEATGWTEISSDEIALYKVSYNWFLRQIMNALKMGENAVPQTILEEKIWSLGQVWLEQKKIPLLIVRNLRFQETYETLNRHLLNNHARQPALVLVLDRNLPDYFRLPGQSVLLRLEEAMMIESDAFALNIRFLAEKMGGSVTQSGFTNGWRNLASNGNNYSFTKKQAEVMEFLDKANRPVHQSEILSQTSSSQEKLLNLFRSQGKTHSAWSVIIKSDRSGNYWLEY